jgi:membrane protein YdbS with pleckstrin-like domain
VFHENFLFVEKGVFSRSKDITEYFRIIDIRKQQPFYLRPFNLAIYHLFTSDVNENKITMKAVLNDDDFLFLKLRELINESRKKYRLLETI